MGSCSEGWGGLLLGFVEFALMIGVGGVVGESDGRPAGADSYGGVDDGDGDGGYILAGLSVADDASQDVDVVMALVAVGDAVLRAESEPCVVRLLSGEAHDVGFLRGIHGAVGEIYSSAGPHGAS